MELLKDYLQVGLETKDSQGHFSPVLPRGGGLATSWPHFSTPLSLFRQTGGAACTACVPGQYQDEVGGSGCKPCPSGKYSETGGADDCKTCAAGQYQDVFPPKVTYYDGFGGGSFPHFEGGGSRAHVEELGKSHLTAVVD